MEKTLKHLRALVEFAYANGYHELGYDPVREIEGLVKREREFYEVSIKAAEAAQQTLWRRITALESELDELAKHADHLNSRLVALDERADTRSKVRV